MTVDLEMYVAAGFFLSRHAGLQDCTGLELRRITLAHDHSQRRFFPESWTLELRRRPPSTRIRADGAERPPHGNMHSAFTAPRQRDPPGTRNPDPRRWAQLQPWIQRAMARHPSDVLFPRADGRQHSPDVQLQDVLRRASGAGLRSPGQWSCTRASFEPAHGSWVYGIGGTVRPTLRPHTGHGITSSTWRCATGSQLPGQSSGARATLGA